MTKMPFARESVDNEDPLSWTERFYQTIPVSPIWVGVGIVGALLVLFLAIAWVFGGLAIVREADQGLWEYREVRFGILVALLAGYLPIAHRYVVLGAKKNVDDLLPLLDTSSGRRDAVLRRFGLLDARAARTAGFLGILIAPITALLIDRDPTLYLQSAYWAPEQAFAWIVGAWVGWNLGVFVYSTLAYARRFSDLAGEVGENRPLRSLRNCPLCPPGSAIRLAVAGPALSGLAQRGGSDLVLQHRGDCSGGWDRSADSPGSRDSRATSPGKEGRARASSRGDSGGSRRALRLPDRRTRDEPPALRSPRLPQVPRSVREWPFDAPSMLRFALYLAIPLGSWLGGAFVERLLGAALD